MPLTWPIYMFNNFPDIAVELTFVTLSEKSSPSPLLAIMETVLILGFNFSDD